MHNIEVLYYSCLLYKQEKDIMNEIMKNGPVQGKLIADLNQSTFISSDILK